jgi:mRNA interferase MazF
VVAPSAGDVVLVAFPFSDLSQTKVRPAVCLADGGRGDWILCQVTSNSYDDTAAVQLDGPRFRVGRALGKAATTRNWATILKLHALIQDKT